jgi:hypothetical protein
MDILASVVAYLTCVTGILAALVMSFFVVLSTPEQPTAAKYVVTHAVQQTALQTSTAPALSAKSIIKSAPWLTPPPGDPVVQSSSVASDRQLAQKVQAQNARRLVEEERAKRWAYRQDPDFESRFLSYAN